MALGYYIYRDGASDPTLSTTHLFTEDFDVEGDTTYYYTVSSVDKDGYESYQSAPVYVETRTTTITPVTIFSDDCTSLTGWNTSTGGVGSSVTQVTYDGASCFRMECHTLASLFKSIVGATHNSGFTVTMRTYFDHIGTEAGAGAFCLYVGDDPNFYVSHYGTDGMFVASEWSMVEIGTDIVAEDVWTTWKLVYSAVSGGSRTVTVYKDNVLQGGPIDTKVDYDVTLFYVELNDDVDQIVYIDSILITEP